MALRIIIRDDAAPLTVTNSSQLNEALERASDEARRRKLLGAILVEADNGNFITMVVGGEETVLGFDYGNQDAPNYASRGSSDSDVPLMTCFMTMRHHTEFPRKYVIPVADGVEAIRQFLDSSDLPTCINWEEV
jgi:hypothetical protein